MHVYINDLIPSWLLCDMELRVVPQTIIKKKKRSDEQMIYCMISGAAEDR